MNCIIIHGCPSNREKAMNSETRTYDKHWMPWIKKELSSKNISVETPLMPEPWVPVYEAYKKEIEKYNIGEDTILIGHSCGGAFLVRWLGDTKKKIKKLILVAPWKVPEEGNEVKKKFYNYPIDYSVKSRVNEIIIFTSDNEAENGKKSVKIFQEALGAKLIELKGRGHFIEKHMHTQKFPELLKEILE